MRVKANESERARERDREREREGQRQGERERRSGERRPRASGLDVLFRIEASKFKQNHIHT